MRMKATAAAALCCAGLMTATEASAWCVKVPEANLRKGPGQDYAVLATLPEGARVSCLDVSGKWCRVVTDDGATGWVHTSLLR